MSHLVPFADDSGSQSIGDLAVENGTDKVSIHGSLDITRDKAGLTRARALRAVLDDAIRTLEADQQLPETIGAPEPTIRVKNPFA
ncbi:MAG TPA: hypothetical protein VGD16_02160 [Enterovirga sp.]|jgi:hypothetical protein